ncbi:hypothetical protein ACJX0J_013037, partial [Zea mays]
LHPSMLLYDYGDTTTAIYNGMLNIMHGFLSLIYQHNNENTEHTQLNLLIIRLHKILILCLLDATLQEYQHGVQIYVFFVFINYFNDNVCMHVK